MTQLPQNEFTLAQPKATLLPPNVFKPWEPDYEAIKVESLQITRQFVADLGRRDPKRLTTRQMVAMFDEMGRMVK